MRRAFVDAGHAQIHYWRGSLREETPLVMFHASPGSSHSLLPYARILSQTRDVIVMDTPGNGDSTPCDVESPTILELAAILSEGIRQIGRAQYFAYGYHTRASIALALAKTDAGRPRRLILNGISFFTPEERARLLKNDRAPLIAFHQSGSHLQVVWHMSRSAHIHWPWWDRSRSSYRGRDVPDAADLHYETLKVLNLETYHLSYRAALGFADKTTYLAAVSVPILATCSRTDQLWNALKSVSKVCPAAKVIEIPGSDRHEDRICSCRIFDQFLAETFADEGK